MLLMLQFHQLLYLKIKQRASVLNRQNLLTLIGQANKKLNSANRPIVANEITSKLIFLSQKQFVLKIEIYFVPIHQGG